jgi:hypothetical protein
VLERVLGAPAGCLRRISREELSQWLVLPSLQKEEQRVQPQSIPELMDTMKESKQRAL